jgi:hypothetical protein
MKYLILITILSLTPIKHEHKKPIWGVLTLNNFE